MTREADANRIMVCQIFLRFSRCCIRTALAALLMVTAAAAADVSDTDFISQVARDIAHLTGAFPQLADFSVQKHMDLQQLRVTYGYRTHRAPHRGGWTSGVPNPDRDGVWFHIDVHEPDSTAQIHTQAIDGGLCKGGKRVAFLILEGAGVNSLRAGLSAILVRHGAKPCAR